MGMATRVLPLLLVALVLAAGSHAFLTQNQPTQRLLNGLGHAVRAATTLAPLAPGVLPASRAFQLKAAVTSWEAQKEQGFVPPPAAVQTLVGRVQGKMDGEPLVFEETLKAIDAHYDYTPRRFVNGDLESAEGTNAGSCKVLSMGILHGLDPATLLKLFGEHYRSVLKTPTGTDHGNIRNMMTKGWRGVWFPDGLGLALKK